LFSYIVNKNFRKWELSLIVLFEAGFFNLNQEDIFIQTNYFKDLRVVFGLVTGSGDQTGKTNFEIHEIG